MTAGPLLAREINWMETLSTPFKGKFPQNHPLLAREINWMETDDFWENGDNTIWPSTR